MHILGRGSLFDIVARLPAKRSLEAHRIRNVLVKPLSQNIQPYDDASSITQLDTAADY